MIPPRTKGRIYLQSFMDALITFSSFWACLFLFVLLHVESSALDTKFLDRYLASSFVAFGAVLLQGLRTIYTHPAWWTPTLKESHNLSFNQLLNVVIAISLFLVATRDNSISRTFLVSWLPLLYLALLIANRFLPAKIGEMLYHGRRERTVFLGDMESIQSLAAWRDAQHALGTDFLDYKPDFSISDLANLERLLRERNVTQLILTEIPEVKYNLHYVIDICERVGVRLMVVNNLEHLFRHKVTVSEDAGLQFIGLREEPLERAHNRFIKRALDLVLAILVLLFVFPITALVVWMVQRFQSPGPLFSREARAGLNEQKFAMLKFRTKHSPASGGVLRPPADQAPTFPIGQWLRRTGLDEMPQFLNVLRGEMSVVGPRPHLHESELFARAMRNHYVRSDVKPGLTGLAQVNGFRGEFKSEQEVHRRVELDISYVETWSLTLDLIILVRTVWQIVRPRL